MNRPAYALPNVADEDVAAILAPLLDAAERLRSPHSIITARDAINRLLFATHTASAALSALDFNATMERTAQMRRELA